MSHSDWRSEQARQRAAVLVDALRGLPHVTRVEVKAAPRAAEHDAVIDLRIRGKPLSLVVDVKSEVYPRQARGLIERWASTKPSSTRVVVSANHLSESARALLLEAGIGSHADDGKLRLPFDEAYVIVDAPASPSARRLPRLKLFTAARTPVLHALLLAPDRWCSVKELAMASGISTANVSKLLTHLEQEEVVISEGLGPAKVRRLDKPASLLDAWVAQEQAQLAQRRVRKFFVPGRKGDGLLQLINESSTAIEASPSAYALTAEAAASFYAPYLTAWSITTVRATSDWLADLLMRTDIREVDQGANLHVVEVEPAGVPFVQRRGEVLCASPVQTYVDLMVASGRGPDAGRFLREQVLGF
ncbi:MarR family transcriptional regulator [Roseateles sp.]|uniref:MarR family transcriptional regulator n=1 Tax=Roseateles sp. TaxID=1971397 RepID=UPI0031D1BE37